MTTSQESIKPPAGNNWLTPLARLGPLLGLIAIIAFFSFRTDKFRTFDNAQNILQQTSLVGTAAIGATLVIISAGLDLSVGSIVGMTSVVAALILFNGYSPVLAILGAVAAGTLAGCVNGLLITRLRIMPFIVTLGALAALRGLTERLGSNATVYPSPTWLNHLELAPASIFDAHPVTLANHPPQWVIFAPAVWIMLVFIILVSLVMRFTRWGRHVYAVGSNEQTARLCGVNVGLTKVTVYAVAGLFAGIAGILAFAQEGQGDVTAAEGLELNVIAAVVLGGASLNGGQGSVFGTLVGALIMTVIANGCAKLQMPSSDQKMLTGGIIVLAAAIDHFLHRKKG